jgi:NADH:ubiquinone oxidoreductase subunit E
VIKICEGTACHVNNGKTILKSLQNELGISVGETSADGLFSLQSVACLGCCSLAPVIMVNDDTHGNLTAKKVQKIIKKYRDL